MARKGQGGFVEAFASQRLGRNGRLERIDAQVRWHGLEKLLGKLAPEGAGRPPYAPLQMFKALLLAQLYGLSDAELEEALNDRVSFRRFVGLTLDAEAPDHTTICRFRNRLVEAGLVARLFAEFELQLNERGFVLKHGTMVDATLIEAARRRPPHGLEDKALDADARFAKKEGKPGAVYGYKAHVGVDCGTRLIRSAVLTPANVNETVVAERLIRFDEKAVYADKAYAKAERRQMLKACRIKDRIMHKSWGGGPELSPWQQRRNALIARRRAEVETVFAVLKRRLFYRAARYVGLIKNAAHLLLLAIAYNMRRVADLRAA